MSIKRQIKKEMDFYRKKYPVLALTGPRQSGKTTFLRNEFPAYQYVSMENPDIRSYAESDPNSFLKQYDKYVIFDEVQRVPFLFSYIQTKVDEDKIMGQYILSGSQNFQLMHHISQSLAGRVALFKLLPFDFNELKSAKLLQNDYACFLHKGFYPAIYDRDIPPKIFYSNYIQTYIERDLPELIQIKDLKLFRNFISLTASRAGQVLNINKLAMDCGISQPTAKSWLGVLETSYIIFQLQPYHSNLNKRITKSAKLYFYDTGLLAHLFKVKDSQQIALSQHKGALFENFIIAECIKYNYHNNLQRDFYFWRDAVGHEIDLIWQDDEQLNLVEIKASETIMNTMFDGIHYFEALLPDLIKSRTLVYAGLSNQRRKEIQVKSWLHVHS